MNTIIHYITYACQNAAASPVRRNLCLASPDLGRFWSGVAPPVFIFPAGFLFLPLLDIICILDIGSLDLIVPVALSCVRFYRPSMVVVVVAVFVNVVNVVVLGSGRPPHGPLPPCHPPNVENKKAWDLISDDDSDPNDRSHFWVIRKSIILMEKSIVDGGNGEKKPFSLERRKLALKGLKKENKANSNSSK